MAFLLRVELPDVPGSLGAVASAIGTSGADIHAIEIVEHREAGTAVDDVLLDLPPQVLPDTVVSACHRLDGVRVLWISRYNAGASLRLDLEAVEAMTAEPKKAVAQLVELVPVTFRCDWALAICPLPDGGVERLAASDTAPDLPTEAVRWLTSVERPVVLSELPEWEGTVLAAAPLGDGVVVLGRRGGPAVLDSELARFGHLCGLATAISAAAG
ncbi:MAG: amino acid-binding protein [Nocardioidaceae bacterium]|nr:amino acid-binding protein [Nocardioidaceae bacterium]